MSVVIRILDEERLPPSWDEPITGEPDNGTICIDIVDKLLPIFSGGARVDFYYEDGFAKHLRYVSEAQLRRRFPKSYPA